MPISGYCKYCVFTCEISLQLVRLQLGVAGAAGAAGAAGGKLSFDVPHIGDWATETEMGRNWQQQQTGEQQPSDWGGAGTQAGW